MPDGSDGPVLWHPPLHVLEILELVLTGALAGPPVEIVPPSGDGAGSGGVLVLDSEGTPVARLAGGRVLPERPFTHGPLRGQRRDPAQVRAALDAGRVLAVAVAGPIPAGTAEELGRRARADGLQLLWLAVVGEGHEGGLPAPALWRAVLAARDSAGGGTAVPVAVPRLPAAHVGSAAVDLLGEVARAYGADEVVQLRPAPAGAALHPASARELARARPEPHRRGVTVFLTGLSGSGKSTIARALAERLLVDGRREVSLLDGDEVRRLLSHGLGFGRADRDLNIRRIGFVAAEITRHGGFAVCAPIAPFAEVRREVRGRVQAVGEFVLVHVATPLAECERRDRKGLYARARQGLIGDFTGISSPYEEPTDAELRIDTTELAVADAVDRIWELLGARGYLGEDPGPARR